MSTPADPRDFPPTLPALPRDAAVDPHPEDFLPPLNAGEAGEAGNPHGPNVVAPGIHGDESVRGIRPGPVADDPAVQSVEELEHLAAALAGGGGEAPFTITGMDPETGLVTGTGFDIPTGGGFWFHGDDPEDADAFIRIPATVTSPTILTPDPAGSVPEPDGSRRGLLTYMVGGEVVYSVTIPVPGPE